MITKRYKNLRGSSRRKLYNTTNHAMIFQNKITGLPSIATTASATQSQSNPVNVIQLHGKKRNECT